MAAAAAVALWPVKPAAIGQQPSAVTIELSQALSRAAPSERIPVLIEVDRASTTQPLAIERDLRAAEHASNLADFYSSSVDDLRRRLPDELYLDLQAAEVIWIGGALTAQLTAEQIRSLETQSGVRRLYYDGLIQVDLAGPSQPAPLRWAPGLPPAQAPGDLSWGLEVIGAPQLWATGATGEGTIVASIDSGIDGDHPLLGRKWRGLTTSPQQTWFDPWGLTEQPLDDNGLSGVGHGTLALSAALGSLEPGDTLFVLGQPRVIQDDLEFVTGVAPGAQWVAANGFEEFGGFSYTRLSVLLQSMQWVLDPDGDPTTVSDIPDIVNNSWGFRPGGCDGVFDRAIDALELSGVPVVFAAGNRSAGFDTVASPAERADLLLNAFAVGAAQFSDGEITVSPNSLGGPSPCAPGAVKPEVVAPGDVPIVVALSPQTADLRGTNGVFTSWAAPYVTGSLAVLAGLNPSASSNDLKGALFSTATDLDPPGLDNRSGAGFINLVAAADAIGGLGGVQLALDGWDWSAENSSLALRLFNSGDSPFPGGAAELSGAGSAVLARAQAPLIGPRGRGQIVFEGLSGEGIEDTPLDLALESDGARLVFPILLRAATASSLTLADGGVSFSLDANGRLGQVAGAPGFFFLDGDWLTAGALLFASGDRVSDAAYVDVLQQPSLKSNPVGSDTDWRVVSVTGQAASADVTFSDDRALRPLGATVDQAVELVEVSDSSAFAVLTASVAFRAEVSVPLVGLILDWDFAGGDLVRWDSLLGASVTMPASSTGPWFALTSAPQSPNTHAAVPLGTPQNGFYTAGSSHGVLSTLEGFTDDEKGRLLALGGLQASDERATDWAQLVAVGPLQSGDTTVFLVAAGSSRQQLQLALDSARAFVLQRAEPTTPAAASGDLVLLPPYPNPFDPVLGEVVKLPFLMNRGSEPLTATVEIFNIAGWPVYAETRELTPDLPVEPFRWSGLLANGEPAATGVYGYILRVGSRVSSGKFVLLK